MIYELRNQHLPLGLDYLKKGYKKLDEQDCTEVKSRVYLIFDLIHALKAIRFFKKAEDQATVGVEVATSFENILKLLQIKMTSSVILECFTELDGR